MNPVVWDALSKMISEGNRMALYIVIVKHGAESCPTGNPEMGNMLLAHIHQDNASKFGITVQASAGAESQHTLHILLEAADRQKVDEFMGPFAQIGTVEVTPGITCEAIVARSR